MRKRPNRRRAETAKGAVKRFEKARDALHEFMDDNDDFMDELRSLVDDYNVSLKEATTSIKAELKNSDKKKLIIGPLGALKKRTQVWDGTELARLFPARISQHFLTEKVTYLVDEERLDQMIRQGELDRDKAFKAYSEKPPTLSLIAGCPKALVL